jgi:hypothetical protein
MTDRKFFSVTALFIIAIFLVVYSPDTFSFTPPKKRKTSKTNPENQKTPTNNPDSSSKSTTNSNDYDEEGTNAKTSSPPSPPAPTKKSSNKNSKPSKNSPKLRYEFSEEQQPSEADLQKLRDSCSVPDLEKAAFFDNSSGTWQFRNWCSKFTSLPSPFSSKKSSSSSKIPTKKMNSFKKSQVDYEKSLDTLPFRLDSDQLRSLFQNQVTLFVGDSVVRNHFVLTMARMCNEAFRGKCMIMMPTYEYDIVKPDATKRGPLGCIPQQELDERKKKKKNNNKKFSANTTTISPKKENQEEAEEAKEGAENEKQKSSGSNSGSGSVGEAISSTNVLNNNKKNQKSKKPVKKPKGKGVASNGDEEEQQQESTKTRRDAQIQQEQENTEDSETTTTKKPVKITRKPATSPPIATAAVVDADNLFEAAEIARRSAQEESLTDCYKNGTFQFVPAPGLTTSREPRRSERKAFLKKGVITPLIRMEVAGAVFFYVPVNTPKQIVKFGKWLALKAAKSRVGAEMTKAKTVFVSTGPHLSVPEMNSSIQLLKPALTLIQSSLRLDSSVILSETTHLLNGPPWYAEFVDGVMEEWKRELATTSTTSSSTSTPKSKEESGDQQQDSNENSPATNAPVFAPVDFVPQRFVTIGGYFSGGRVREVDGQESLRRQQKTCVYYDAQHPASACQEVLTELMLMTAYASRARKIKEKRNNQ